MTKDNGRAVGAPHAGHDQTGDNFDDCEQVLGRVYEFLDHELDTASGDAIRRHLADCEPCLEKYDVDQAVKSVVARCCGNDPAPATLREKVLLKLALAKAQAATAPHVP